MFSTLVILCAIAVIAFFVNRKLERIVSTQQQLAESLNAATALVTKIGTEVQGLKDKIVELEAAVVAAGNVTPEVQAALDGLNAKIAQVDALVPDAETQPEDGDGEDGGEGGEGGGDANPEDPQA